MYTPYSLQRTPAGHIDVKPADGHLVRILLPNYTVKQGLLLIQPCALPALEAMLQCLSN